MKFRFCIFLGLILLGCETTNIDSAQNNLGANITSLQNESIVVKDPGGVIAPFGVSVLTINDSRCPSDVECVWAGMATVNFLIEGYAFQLSIGQSKVFTIGSQQFKITLIDVKPYPTSSNSNEKKTAIFKVIRL